MDDEREAFVKHVMEKLEVDVMTAVCYLGNLGHGLCCDICRQINKCRNGLKEKKDERS